MANVPAISKGPSREKTNVLEFGSTERSMGSVLDDVVEARTNPFPHGMHKGKGECDVPDLS